MKKRIRALKAIILVVLMVVELFGVDALRALADQYLDQDYTINADTTEEYGTNGYSLTIADGVTASGAIYVSGGALVNYGTAGTVKVSKGTITNSGIITSVSVTDAEAVINQNSGSITTLESSYSNVVNLSGGTINQMQGPMNVEASGDVTVGTLSGAMQVSGNGTIRVMDALNLTNGYTGETPIVVNKNTVISTTESVQVTYDGMTFELQNVSGKTLVEAMGNTILAELQSPDTLVAETDFPSEKQLRSITPVTAVYTAQEGYYFPDNYGVSVSDASAATAVTAVSENHQKITVNLTLVKDGQTIQVILPAADPKGEQAAPTGLIGGVGQVSGVTADMEYAASETETDWTAVTGISAEGTMKLAKGTWYFRYRETDTKQAGAAAAVIVKEAEKEPEIIRAEGNGTIRVKDIYYGKLPSIQISSETNDITQAVIVYKEKGKPDAAYEKTAPSKVGSYTVRVTLPQNDAYKEVVMTADFRITYLSSPTPAYTLAGTVGENGYYTSDVIVTPAEGYTIAAAGGRFSDSLSIRKTQAATTIYLKNAAGEMTDAISLEAVRIKREAPKLNLEDGKTYYGETQRLEIQDAYLNRVYVNGVLQTLTGPEFVLELSSNHGKKRYEITAVDDAGNKKTIVVDVAASWMKTGVVPDGVMVNLESGNGYKLGSGNWKVEGDETSYSGNTAFYVKKDGSYTFKSQ